MSLQHLEQIRILKKLNSHMNLILSVLLPTLVISSAIAQRPPAISSPDVNVDKSITFRYF